ncbi:hypothetical protein QVD17_24338 [Tagetes erecta]|uniref:Uncharacterized protein n=1 Tax=Tagetes erecta TaxID=13708 RepID=A0AAD8KHZ7_TARER|nr:hypothetical protein QVD17_24338 [Tagetes erecta]
MLKAKEEINHALIAEIVKESAHDDNYIDCFDPFKEFYYEDGENSDEVVDELKVVRDEEVQDGIDGEAGVKTEVQTDVIVQGHLGQEEIIQSGLVCEADDKKEMRVFATIDHEKKNAEEQKLNMKQ